MYIGPKSLRNMIPAAVRRAVGLEEGMGGQGFCFPRAGENWDHIFLEQPALCHQQGGTGPFVLA